MPDNGSFLLRFRLLLRLAFLLLLFTVVLVILPESAHSSVSIAPSLVCSSDFRFIVEWLVQSQTTRLLLCVCVCDEVVLGFDGIIDSVVQKGATQHTLVVYQYRSYRRNGKPGRVRASHSVSFFL